MVKLTKREVDDHQAEVDAWLAKGNKITVCEPGARTEDVKTNMWGGKKKKKPEEKIEDKK